MNPRRHSIRRAVSYIPYRCWHWLLLAAFLPKVTANNNTCSLESDGASHVDFSMAKWLRRGICLKKAGKLCNKKLLPILQNLNSIRAAEYSAAATVLSLLPTIGALLGAPTNEIWRLMTILPFGGGLMMTMSFGGAIMHVRVEEYEQMMTKRSAVIGSIISLRHHPEASTEGSTDQKLKQLVERSHYVRIAVNGGESITTCFRASEAEENVGTSLHQLDTLRSATVTIEGSQQFTQSRNATFILVSIVGDTRLRSLSRLISKASSIAVFVAGMATFASASLLSLVLVSGALTMILAAGVFGRAIAGWIVDMISKNEPMIHIIADSHKEAYRAVTEILTLRPTDGGHFQVLMDGHVFINERRDAQRTRWWVNLLGVLAEPFDLRRVHKDSPFIAPLLNAPSADSATTLFSPIKCAGRTFTFESQTSE
ncbi:MAG: hypothetical protein Q9160_009240 [Pyrenula sp. 1 TL-2023]